VLVGARRAARAAETGQAENRGPAAATLVRPTARKAEVTRIRHSPGPTFDLCLPSRLLLERLVNEGKKGPLASDSEGHSGMSDDSDEDEPVTASAAEKPVGASPANSPTPAKQRTAGACFAY